MDRSLPLASLTADLRLGPLTRPWQRLMRAADGFLISGTRVWLIWALVRLAVLVTWGVFRPETQGDVVYYYRNIDHMMIFGPERTMPEYPTPVLWMLSLPWWLGGGSQESYVAVFVALMLGLDIAFSWTLWRFGKDFAVPSLMMWTAFVGFIGPTMYLRFDIVTSVLAGWSILALVKRKNILAACGAGLGAAIKLWPALLWPALCTGKVRHKIATSAAFWISGGLLALVSLWWAGWERLLSPLTWQSGRGLQVESVWASIPMALRAVGLGDYAVTISRFQAFEIYGTGVWWWMHASTIATVLGLGSIVVLYAVWWRRGQADVVEASAFVMMVIVVMIVTNKTFSPQYMIWLGAPMAAGLAMLGSEDHSSPHFAARQRRLVGLSAALIVATVLTGIVFPIGYQYLVSDWPGWWFYRLLVTAVLVTRNGVMVMVWYKIMDWTVGIVRGKR